MNKVVSFLSNKYVSVIIILISITVRIINVLFVSFYGRDKMILVLQSQSLLNGKGLGVPQYLTSESVTPVYNYTPFWPPGYPILLAPFLRLFNYDIYWATTTLDIIASICLIFIVRKICRQIGLSVAAVNIMTLITGCFEYTFISESLPTDTISLVLFLVGLSFLIKTCVAANFSLGQLLITSFILFSPAIVRYGYPAISIATVSGILFNGYLRKDLVLKRKAWWLLAFTSIFILFYMLIIKLTAGQVGYVTPTQRGVFPENLAHWFPFIPSAFINIAFLTSQAIHLANIPFLSSMQLLELLNALLFIVLLFLFIVFMLRKKTFEKFNSLNLFLIAGSFACLGLLALLGYMSLTYQMQMGIFSNWNYIYEPRYYAFAVLFLQIGLIAWLFSKPINFIRKTSFTKIIAGICVFALFIEITHNIYFHTKVAFNFKEYKSAVYREQDYSYYISLLDGIKNKYPGYEVWAAAPGDNFYQYLATYHGHIGIADPNNFKSGITVKKKTLLILMLYDHEIKEYQTFLSSSSILDSKRISNSNFYSIELKP
jgi:hypothetical protein